MTGTLGLAAGRLELESIVRAALVVVADPVVAASGPPATLDEVSGGGARLLERPAGRMVALANPSAGSGLFVWAGAGFVAVVADPNVDTGLNEIGELTVVSGRLVVGAPDVVAAWGPDVDTGDGSTVRARMHRGRTRLGLVVIAHSPLGQAPVRTAAGAAAVTFPSASAEPAPLLLAG